MEGDPGACPATGQAGYHKVTVKVTNEDETGTVALVTDTGRRDAAVPGRRNPDGRPRPMGT